MTLHVGFLREFGRAKRAFDLFKVGVFDFDVSGQRILHLIRFAADLTRNHGFGFGLGLVDDLKQGNTGLDCNCD